MSDNPIDILRDVAQRMHPDKPIDETAFRHWSEFAMTKLVAPDPLCICGTRGNGNPALPCRLHPYDPKDDPL